VSLVHCDVCGGSMTITRDSWQYEESGLRNVILEGIEVRSCQACGTREPVIPRIEELHGILARAVTPSRDVVPRHANMRVRFDGTGWTASAV